MNLPKDNKPNLVKKERKKTKPKADSNTVKLMGLRIIWNRLWNITKELPGGIKIGYTWAISVDGRPIENTKLFAIIVPIIETPQFIQGIGTVEKRESIQNPGTIENKKSGTYITEDKNKAEGYAKHLIKNM